MMNSLTSLIRARAQELGIQKIGIARAERLDIEGERLRQWVERGYSGSMSWMGRNVERRVDPREVLTGANSVLVAAVNYYTDIQHSDDPSTGKISRYAWGDDYHDVVKKKLDLLLEYIKTVCPDAEGRVYVDTGPIMEKVWAQRAGIGWEGKHTNVISIEYGSWIFLGEILLTLELEYDAPALDHCGTCTLCIDVCPTDAISEPYVVDSNRCISYLTIEHRGEIAVSLGENFDRWVYGCDICQDVCPWNEKFASPSSTDAFLPRERNIAPPLAGLIGMTQEEFSRSFSKSPIKRTKLSGLQRNARVVAKTSTS